MRTVLLKMFRLALSLALVGLVGCISVPVRQIPTIIPINTVSMTAIKLSNSNLTVTATSSPKPIPMPSETIQPTPTWTQLPTLPQSAVENFMANNGGCELPCWWSITPGKTTWSEAQQFLERFGTVEKADASFSTLATRQTYIAFFWNPGTDDSNGALIEVENDEINIIKLDPETTRYMFRLNQLLSEYGAPETIYVRRSNLGFNFYLFYTNRHILADFYFAAPDTDNPNRVCLSRGPHLYLWSPDREWTEEQIRLNTSYRNIQSLTQLEEVTHYNPQTFYTKFKEPHGSTCLEVNASGN